jgi:hypothetical protein
MDLAALYCIHVQKLCELLLKLHIVQYTVCGGGTEAHRGSWTWNKEVNMERTWIQTVTLS